jgi:hypothetical protein
MPNLTVWRKVPGRLPGAISAVVTRATDCVCRREQWERRGMADMGTPTWCLKGGDIKGALEAHRPSVNLVHSSALRPRATPPR